MDVKMDQYKRGKEYELEIYVIGSKKETNEFYKFIQSYKIDQQYNKYTYSNSDVRNVKN